MVLSFTTRVLGTELRLVASAFTWGAIPLALFVSTPQSSPKTSNNLLKVAQLLSVRGGCEPTPSDLE